MIEINPQVIANLGAIKSDLTIGQSLICDVQIYEVAGNLLGRCTFDGHPRKDGMITVVPPTGKKYYIAEKFLLEPGAKSLLQKERF
jgi:hypothetical protein